MKTRSSLSKQKATWQPRLVAELYESTLIKNFESIRKLVRGQELLPMVKANAYGHDATWVARLLAPRKGLYGFGVATLEEGGKLREGLGSPGRRSRIVVFSAATPWSEEKGAYCEHHHLMPAITSDEDWRKFLQGGWPGRLPYQLKFNTGMNRLGLSLSMATEVARHLRNRPSSWQPAGVLSHLAMGEEPSSPLSIAQRARFEALRRELSGLFPNTLFHLANSAGIWNRKAFGLDGLTDIVRPGLALYGIPPWRGASKHGVYPVMTVKAYVITRHVLKPGESLGYGGTFTVPVGGRPVHVAILASGYADGIHRAISNRGHVWLGGRRTRVLGSVAMDLCAVECPSNTKVGDWVELIGPHTDLWEQARYAGTIPYELLTSVSGRVQRVYV